MPTKLRNLVIREGSLVDEPANKLARVVLFKRAREPDIAKEGIQTTDKPSVLQRIKEAFAKMMGMGNRAMTMDQMMNMQEKEQELYSKEWEYRDAFDSSVRSIMGDESMEMDKKKEMLSQTMEQYHGKLMEHMEAMMSLMQETQQTEMAKGNKQPPADIPPVNESEVNKKEGEDPMPVTFEEFLKALSAEERAKVEIDLAKRYAPAKVEVPAEITKRLEDLEKTAGQVADLQKRATDAEAKLAKAESDLAANLAKAQDAEFLAKGAKYSHAGTPEQVAAKLKKAHSVSKEFGDEYEADLAKAETEIAKGALFAERGRSGRAPDGSAEAQIEKMAKDKATADKISYEKAYDLVIQENRDLYKRARTEAEKEGN